MNKNIAHRTLDKYLKNLVDEIYYIAHKFKPWDVTKHQKERHNDVGDGRVLVILEGINNRHAVISGIIFQSSRGQHDCYFRFSVSSPHPLDVD